MFGGLVATCLKFALVPPDEYQEGTTAICVQVPILLTFTVLYMLHCNV